MTSRLVETANICPAPSASSVPRSAWDTGLILNPVIHPAAPTANFGRPVLKVLPWQQVVGNLSQKLERGAPFF